MALALVAARGVRATHRNPSPFDAELVGYFDDLLGLYGQRVDERQLSTGANVGYPELAERVLPDLDGLTVDGVGFRGVGMVLVAYAVPDVHPLTCVASHVNHLLGDRAVSMAISEQGLAAPYTALRIAAAHHAAGAAGGTGPALLLVLEQTTLPYHHPLVHDTPLTDSAAAVVLEPAAVDADGIGLPWAGTPATLDALVRRTADERTLVVAGPWVPDVPAEHVHHCPPGTYCTSVWLALAEHRERWSRQFERVLLCDVDPRTSTAHAVRIRWSGA
ncbi:hypothetical protein [Pseudonocardia sp. TRM90224]|uniref:hypothetical protein n=1 Tax=Pseudonocardia sp. TRM90224 TaxID=2812678 RepID=UPI001E346B2F|nr:hypothetical protein [Pseudonocardia sp. TRM90224]